MVCIHYMSDLFTPNQYNYCSGFARFNSKWAQVFDCELLFAHHKYFLKYSYAKIRHWFEKHSGRFIFWTEIAFMKGSEKRISHLKFSNHSGCFIWAICSENRSAVSLSYWWHKWRQTRYEIQYAKIGSNENNCTAKQTKNTKDTKNNLEKIKYLES